MLDSDTDITYLLDLLELYSSFNAWLIAYTKCGALELAASLSSLYCVYLTVKRSIWCWPVGIVGCVLCWIFFEGVKLYSDRDLQIYFIAMSLYGWYHWYYGGLTHDNLPVVPTPVWMWPVMAVGVTVAVLGIGIYRALYTDARLPLIDPLPNVLSVVAQWMLSCKYIENWILWIVVDVMLVAIYWHQQHYFMTATYLIFLGLATKGWLDWRTAMRLQTESEPVPAQQ